MSHAFDYNKVWSGQQAHPNSNMSPTINKNKTVFIIGDSGAEIRQSEKEHPFDISIHTINCQIYELIREYTAKGVTNFIFTSDEQSELISFEMLFHWVLNEFNHNGYDLNIIQLYKFGKFGFALENCATVICYCSGAQNNGKYVCEIAEIMGLTVINVFDRIVHQGGA